MNEDNDFNESLETEPAVEAKKGAPESDGLSGSTNDTEAIGEEILNAAANQAKMSKGGRQKDKAKIAELEAKIAELTSDLQRTRADFENFRRQADLQREQYGKTMEEKTIKKILPIIDDFERASVSAPEAMAPLAKGFEKTMATLGLIRMDTAIGAEFDPELHFATSVEGDGDTETIAETLQPGYYYGGEVIRPALVKVNKQ